MASFYLVDTLPKAEWIRVITGVARWSMCLIEGRPYLIDNVLKTEYNFNINSHL